MKTTLNKLKKGELFKMKPEANETYTKVVYDRSERAWICKVSGEDLYKWLGFCHTVYTVTN